MDRLYSRFPAGSVGLALFLLRLVDGAGLVGVGIHALPAGTSSEPTSLLLLCLALVASAILLILGLRTSFAGGVAAISTAGTALRGAANEMYVWAFLFTLVFFISASLALLGPGGYSLDARFSGWQRIKLSRRQPNERGEGTNVDR